MREPAMPNSTPMTPPALCTRRNRVLNLLALPLCQLESLLASLQPHLVPFARSPHSPYEASAFVHAFGVRGPANDDWTRLFELAQARRLRGEQIAICVACVASGGSFGKSKTKLLHQVVLGTEGVPGVLEKVCDSFDDWLVSVQGLQDEIGRVAESKAGSWWLERVGEGSFVWMCQVGNVGGVWEECRLGDSVEKCAWRIGVEATKKVVEEKIKCVSWEGLEEAVRRVGLRAGILAEGGRGRAARVLVGRVFEVLGG